MGTVLVYKVAAALARSGASLDVVEGGARLVAERVATIGVGLEHCHVSAPLAFIAGVIPLREVVYSFLALCTIGSGYEGGRNVPAGRRGGTRTFPCPVVIVPKIPVNRTFDGFFATQYHRAWASTTNQGTNASAPLLRVSPA